MTHLNKGAARPIKLTKPLSTCQIMRMCPNWPILKNVLEFQGYFKKRTFPKKALQRPQKDTFMCTIGRSRHRYIRKYVLHAFFHYKPFSYWSTPGTYETDPRRQHLVTTVTTRPASHHGHEGLESRRWFFSVASSDGLYGLSVDY